MLSTIVNVMVLFKSIGLVRRGVVCNALFVCVLFSTLLLVASVRAHTLTGENGFAIEPRFEDEEDIYWTETRESDESCVSRGVELLRFLASRPESDIAVVSHSSFLRHLFS